MRTLIIFLYTLSSAILIYIFYSKGNTDAVIEGVLALLWYGLSNFQHRIIESQQQLLEVKNDAKP